MNTSLFENVVLSLLLCSVAVGAADTRAAESAVDDGGDAAAGGATGNVPWETIVDVPVRRIKPGRLPEDLPRMWTKRIRSEKSVEATASVLKKARANAIERLGARFKKEEIYPGVTIEQYIAASDTPEMSLGSFLHGANEKGVRLRRDMLVCEVELTLKLRTAVTSFKSWADTHVASADLDVKRLRTYVEKVHFDFVREIGTAAVEPDYVIEEFKKRQEKISAIVSDTPLWASGYRVATAEAEFDVTGADRNEARKKAYESAIAGAAEELVGKINELPVGGEEKLAAFAATLQEPASSMIRNYLDAPFIEKDVRVRRGKAFVTLEARLKPLWNIVVQHRIKD